MRQLTETERDELKRWSRSRTLAARDVFVASLILALADGKSYTQIPGQGYLARAREYVDGMMKGGIAVVLDGAAEDPRFHDGVLTDPVDIARAVRLEMERANAIAVANGEKPIDQAAMDQTAREVVREGYIARVRDEFRSLKVTVRASVLVQTGEPII